MRALPAPWATAVRACLLRARGALGDDHVFPGNDERRIGRDEVALVRPVVSVLLRGRRHTHRLRVVEPRQCGAVIERRPPGFVGRAPGVALHVAPDDRDQRRQGPVDLGPVLLEDVHSHARLAGHELDVLHAVLGHGPVLDDTLLGDEQAHGGAFDELRLVGLDRRVCRGPDQGAHRAGIVEPDLRDPVVDRLTLAIPGGQGMRLDVAANTRQLDDDVGVGRPPVRLEGFDGHPGLALEERDGLDHAADNSACPAFDQSVGPAYGSVARRTGRTQPNLSGGVDQCRRTSNTGPKRPAPATAMPTSTRAKDAGTSSRARWRSAGWRRRWGRSGWFRPRHSRGWCPAPRITITCRRPTRRCTGDTSVNHSNPSSRPTRATSSLSRSSRTTPTTTPSG